MATHRLVVEPGSQNGRAPNECDLIDDSGHEVLRQRLPSIMGVSMEDRAIRDYRFRKSTQQFLCLFVLLSVSSFADKPWLNKSSDNWDENDVIQILSDSPWVRKEAIRIVPSEERWYRESIFGLFGKEHLYWVRLTWLA